jgi:hypothetical protein
MTTTGSTCTDTVVRKRDELVETVIPFFQQHRLRTSKCQNFDRFVECVELISAGRHLTVDGLIQIAEITETMNRKKPRHELIRILRDYTPETLDRGS